MSVSSNTQFVWGFGRWRRELIGDLTGRVLEVGCGWGHNFNHYGPRAQVTAFDIDLARVQAAQRLAARHQRAFPLALADAQRLPWPGATFDAVVGTLVLCSIPNPTEALQEMRRVLTPTGRLFLIEHVRSDRAWLGSLQDALAPMWLTVTGGCHLTRDTEATVRAAGFTIERFRPGLHGLLKLMVAH